MNDPISRQAVIDALGERPVVWDEWTDEYSLGQRNQYDADRLAIEAVPTIDPVKHGKWVIRSNPGTGWYQVTCPECGEDVTSEAPVIGFFPNAKVIWGFCPYCGMKMDKEIDEDAAD